MGDDNSLTIREANVSFLQENHRRDVCLKSDKVTCVSQNTSTGCCHGVEGTGKSSPKADA
jgi:hypothetical protein